MELLRWDIYQITCSDGSLTGVGMRGTLRKFAVEQGMNLLTENASELENCVRFAVLAGTDVTRVTEAVHRLVATAQVERVMERVVNPVLSKLKINDAGRYNGALFS